MADNNKGPFGFYTVPTPSKKSPPSWRGYFVDYIVPGLAFFAVMKILSLVLGLFS